MLELEPDHSVVLQRLTIPRFFEPEELRDLKVSRGFYRPAVELEFDAAMPVIGSLSRDTSESPSDYEAAVHWFEIASQKGNP